MKNILVTDLQDTKKLNREAMAKIEVDGLDSSLAIPSNHQPIPPSQL